MLISIIIPVYNAQKYLEECLYSILNQNFKDFEVIMVNDGSTDISGELCEKFCLKDNRFVTYHQENMGASSARNLGVTKANGEWITFIDSDDTINPGYLENFSAFVNEHIQLIVQGFIKWHNKDDHGSIKDFNLLQFGRHVHLYPLGPVAKLYRKSIIVKNNVFFDETLHKGEDTDFNLNYLSYCEHIKVFDQNNYNYRNTPNSLSKKRNNYKDGYLLLQKLDGGLKKVVKKNDDIRYFNLQLPMEKLIRSVFLSEEISNRERKKFIRELFERYNTEYLYFFKKKRSKGILFFILIKLKQYDLFEMIYRILFNAFRIK